MQTLHITPFEEVIDTALLLLADNILEQHPTKTPDYLAWVEQTRRKIDTGIQAAEQGKLLDAEDVILSFARKSYNYLRPGLRGLLVMSFIIFYRVVGDDVETLRVVSGYRNWQ